MPASAYDVVVIGAGAGGMTAAAVAAAEGLNVLVIEKTEFVGGTTAWSGGMVWIPVNGKMTQAGLPDSPSDAAHYLASTVPEVENADLRETFLARGPEAVAYLEENTELRVVRVRMHRQGVEMVAEIQTGKRQSNRVFRMDLKVLDDAHIQGERHASAAALLRRGLAPLFRQEMTQRREEKGAKLAALTIGDA